jgi:hypothetical protein
MMPTLFSKLQIVRLVTQEISFVHLVPCLFGFTLLAVFLGNILYGSSAVTTLYWSLGLALGVVWLIYTYKGCSITWEVVTLRADNYTLNLWNSNWISESDRRAWHGIEEPPSRWSEDEQEFCRQYVRKDGCCEIVALQIATITVALITFIAAIGVVGLCGHVASQFQDFEVEQNTTTTSRFQADVDLGFPIVGCGCIFLLGLYGAIVACDTFHSKYKRAQQKALEKKRDLDAIGANANDGDVACVT